MFVSATVPKGLTVTTKSMSAPSGGRQWKLMVSLAFADAGATGAAIGPLLLCHPHERGVARDQWQVTRGGLQSLCDLDGGDRQVDRQRRHRRQHRADACEDHVGAQVAHATNLA